MDGNAPTVDHAKVMDATEGEKGVATLTRLIVSDSQISSLT